MDNQFRLMSTVYDREEDEQKRSILTAYRNIE